MSKEGSIGVHTNKLRSLADYFGVTTLHLRADLEGASWILVLVDDFSLSAFKSAHEDLARKSEYKNVFFESSFACSATRWIARRKVRGLALLERHGDSEKLKFFTPVTLERTGRIGPKFMRVWSNQFAPLSQPLIEARDTQRVVEELCHALDNIKPSVARGLLMDSLPMASEFSKHLIKQGKLTGKLQQFNRFERASLEPTNGQPYSQVHLSGKRRQRLRVARKRLDELGSVTFHEATSVQDVEVAMLDFLFLENRGWKGKRNSALASRPNTRQFAMDVVRELAGSGNCRIFSLQLDGVMIASMVMFISGSHYIPWKITFDERYARSSVGNLLLVHVNDIITTDNEFSILDSVAMGGNDNANQFWPDRIKLCSLAMGFGKSGPQLAHYIARNLSIYGIAKRRIRRIIES